MQRQRAELVPIGEVVSGLDDAASTTSTLASLPWRPLTSSFST